MRNGFLASFVVTVGIGVPMAWHVLDASVERDGKKFRPAQKSFTVDGTRITLDVDRSLVRTGEAGRRRSRPPAVEQLLRRARRAPADPDRSREARADRAACRWARGDDAPRARQAPGEARADRFVHGLRDIARSQGGAPRVRLAREAPGLCGRCRGR